MTSSTGKTARCVARGHNHSPSQRGSSCTTFIKTTGQYICVLARLLFGLPAACCLSWYCPLSVLRGLTWLKWTDSPTITYWWCADGKINNQALFKWISNREIVWNCACPFLWSDVLNVLWPAHLCPSLRIYLLNWINGFQILFIIVSKFVSLFRVNFPGNDWLIVSILLIITIHLTHWHMWTPSHLQIMCLLMMFPSCCWRLYIQSFLNYCQTMVSWTLYHLTLPYMLFMYRNPKLISSINTVWSCIHSVGYPCKKVYIHIYLSSAFYNWYYRNCYWVQLSVHTDWLKTVS